MMKVAMNDAYNQADLASKAMIQVNDKKTNSLGQII